MKASQRHDGLYWRAYDTHMNIAASGNRKWTKPDTDITPGFSCNIWDSSSHTSVSCPLKLRKQPLSDSGRPNHGATTGRRCGLLINVQNSIFWGESLPKPLQNKTEHDTELLHYNLPSSHYYSIESLHITLQSHS